VDYYHVSARAKDNFPHIVEQEAEAGIRHLDDLAGQHRVHRVGVDDVVIEVTV
jgi:hypothetical protein